MAEQSLHCEQHVEHSEGCVCCGANYPGSENACIHCHAPMEISKRVWKRRTQTQFVSVLGGSGAGKTVYLGMVLDMLGQGRDGMTGTPHGAFSLSVQEQTTSALENRRFPDKTPSEADGWQWVHCEVSWGKRKHMDLITPDFAGEAISLEMDASGTFPAIRATVAKSKGVLILCDSTQVCRASMTEDMFALKLATYVHSLQELAREKQRKSSVAVAVVFTKCDRCPKVHDDATAFAEHNLPRLTQFFRRTNLTHQFFATSIVGSCASLIDDFGRQSQIAFHVEPRGAIEPLQWLMNNC